MVPVARASTKPAETLPMPVETCTTPLIKFCEKNPCRSNHAPAGLRGLTRGSADAALWKGICNQEGRMSYQQAPASAGT
jgi:hypothetical protein